MGTLEARIKALRFSMHHGQILTAHLLTLRGPVGLVPIMQWEAVDFSHITDASGAEMTIDEKTRKRALRYLTQAFQDGFVEAAINIERQKRKERGDETKA